MRRLPFASTAHSGASEGRIVGVAVGVRDVYWAQQHALAGKPWRLVNEAAVAPFDVAVEVDGRAFRGQVDMAAIRVEDVVAVAGHHVPRRVSAEPPVASLEACRIGGLNLEEPARGGEIEFGWRPPKLLARARDCPVIGPTLVREAGKHAIRRCPGSGRSRASSFRRGSKG